MTISGETIDYGPCAFLDAFDPATVFSSIDDRRPLRLRQPAGRRGVEPRPVRRDAAAAARRRPGRRRWPLAVESLGDVPRPLQRRLVAPACAPSSACRPVSTRPRRRALVDGPRSRCCRPTTSTTRRSSAVSARRPAATPSRPAGCSSTSPAFDAWAARWRALGPDADAMDRVNPVYIPRNHLVEEALTAATDGDLDAARPAPRRGDRAVRRAARPRAVRRARPRRLRRLPDVLRDVARACTFRSGMWSTPQAKPATSWWAAAGTTRTHDVPDVRSVS